MSVTGSEKKKIVRWSCDDITMFLEIFQIYELLWNGRHVNYMDKPNREIAMNKLREEF